MAPGLLKRENKSDKLADIIGRNIIRNKLKPGEMIYETKIAKEWGISRSPVRDALRMLEQKHLVERTDRGGYRVTEMTAEFIQNLHDAIVILFRYTFAKTAQIATKRSLGALRPVLERLENSLEERDIELYLKGMSDFAQIINRTADNPIVEKMLMELMPNIKRIQFVALTSMPDTMEKTIAQFRRAYESVGENNPEGSTEAFAQFTIIHFEAASQFFAAKRQNGGDKEIKPFIPQI